MFAGIPVPSTSPIFLAMVGGHALLGLICTIAGLIAMLSTKGRGRHSNFGTIYYWCLFGVFVTAIGLSVVRFAEDYHLAILGTLAFSAAFLGRRWRHWPSWHLLAMGASYILLLTAFYVDNGKNLPLWRELPQIIFWFVPAVIGIPIILYVLRTHPVANQPSPFR